MKIFENLNLQDLDSEVWKIIDDYTDYRVSNFGRVKSLKFRKEKILKQFKDKNGYLIINLYKNKKLKTKKVHHLVFEIFKEKLKENYDVHHINKNKEYNFIDNLKQIFHKDHRKGEKHSEKIKKIMSEKRKGKYLGENNPNYKISNKKIIDIKLDIEKGDLTQIEMAKKYNISQSMISYIKLEKVRMLL